MLAHLLDMAKLEADEYIRRRNGCRTILAE
jgi:hypothetical protein